MAPGLQNVIPALLFGAAYLKASTLESAIIGFSKAGIFPLNRNVFTHVDFAPSHVTDQTHTCTAHSSTSDNCVTNAAALTVFLLGQYFQFLEILHIMLMQ